MVPRIYISGSYEDLVNLSNIIKEFEKSFEITYDWTNIEDITLLNNKTYNKAECIVREHYIEHSDFIIIIMDNPNINYFDTIVEIGLALSYSTKVLIYNKININGIYLQHPNILIFDSILDIANHINQLKEV